MENEHCEAFYHIQASVFSNLNGRGVADEGGRHLQTPGRDVADSGLHIVGDPLNKVRAVK
jgi:hypothetical protein